MHRRSDRLGLEMSGGLKPEQPQTAESDEPVAMRLQELTLLLDTARTLTASLEPEMVVQEVVSSAARLLAPGDQASRRTRASMLRIQAESWFPVSEYDQDGFSLSGHGFSVARHPGILHTVDSLRASTVRVEDLEPELASLLAATGVRHCAYVPVQVGTRLYGVLSVDSREARPFAPHELRL